MRWAVLFAAMLGCAAAAADRVWSGPDVNLLGAPSRDGGILTYVDRGDLAFRDLRTGASTRLTQRPSGSKEFAYFSVPSHDGARIAYAWFNAEGFYELRVISRDGSSPTTIFRNEDAGFVQPCAWTPDGVHVLTLLFRRDNISQIVLIPVRGGAPKILRSLNWVYPKRMDLSPDGRFVVYDSFVDEQSEDRAIFVLAADGSSEQRITGEGSFAFPSWTPDGEAIVYAQEPSGLWLHPRKDSRPIRIPQRADRVVPLGVTQSRELLYGVRTGGSDVFVAELADPLRTAKRATIRFAGLNRAPAFSPDGSKLAYLSRRGGENFGTAANAVVIRAMDREEERELATNLAHVTQVQWSSNDTLLVIGSDGRGRGGVYEFRLTGERRVIAEEAGADPRTFDVALMGIEVVVKRREVLLSGPSRTSAASPDGRNFAFVEEDQIVVLDRHEQSQRWVPFSGVTGLDWQRELVAARGAELWSVPLNGHPPSKIATPGNTLAGFALHPDGKRIALTAGGESAEVWRVKLP